MDFRVLGPLEVFDGNAAVALGGPKKRAVLAMLVVHVNQVVSAGCLIEEIWGEGSPKSARRTLHSYVANLRRSLNVDGEILHGRQGGYVLDADAFSIDAVRFASNVELARALHIMDPAKASSLLDETLAMWRGSPFGSFAADVPSLQIESTRIEELRLTAVELRIDCELEAGRGGPAIVELEHLVAEHPYREGLWHRLMLALYRSDRQAEALGAYQRVRRVLAEELGIEPSHALVQLEEQILLQDPVLDLCTIEVPRAVTRAVPGTVPEHLRDHPPVFLSEDRSAQEPIRPVFVGRENELDRLDHFLDDALEGRAPPVFVTGEAGTGKTALVTQFVQRAQAVHPDLVVTGGTCESLTGIGDPYLPFREAMGLLAGDCERPWAAGVISRDHALRLWALLPIVVQAICDSGPTLLDSMVPHRELVCRIRSFGAGSENAFAQLQDLSARTAGNEPSSPPEQRRTFAEYAAILEAIAAHKPLVLVIDDLHWADTSSVQLFANLSRRFKGHRILLIGTYRPEDVAQGRSGEPHPLTEVITDIKHRLGDTSVDLDRVGAAERRSFVDALVDAEPNLLSERFRAQLTERSGGRALFATELLRHVQLQGDLEKDAEGRWVEKGTVSWETLPARVEGVIARLFARLDPGLRDALLAAAVEGVEFTAEVVAAVQDIDELTLISRFSQEAGHRHQLVEARGVRRTGAQPLSRYRFRHSLFQKFLYDHLDPVERSYRHEAVGRALESLHIAHTDDVAVQLASHFHKAGIDDKACLYLQQAGDQSMRLSANTEAIDYYTEALHILKTQPDTTERALRELTLLINLSVPLTVTRGYWDDRINKALTRAKVLCEDLGATTELFAALRGLWHYHHSRLEFDQSGEIAERLLSLATEERDPVLVVQAHWMLGEHLFFHGEFALALDHLTQAVETHDPVAYRSHRYPSVVDPGITSGGFAARTLLCLGFPDRASMQMTDTVALARQEAGSFTLTLATALGLALGLYWESREEELSRRFSEERLRMASGTEYGFVLALDRMNRGAAVAQMEGDFEQGIRLIREGLTGYHGVFLPAKMLLLATAHLTAGQSDEGLRVVDNALALVERAGGYYAEAELWRVKGELYLLAGDEIQANNSIRTAIDTAHRQGARLHELRAIMSLCELQSRHGGETEALGMLTEIYAWYTEGFETHDLREARALLDNSSAGT